MNSCDSCTLVCFILSETYVLIISVRFMLDLIEVYFFVFYPGTLIICLTFVFITHIPVQLTIISTCLL
jgi:hypothetical protein